MLCGICELEPLRVGPFFPRFFLGSFLILVPFLDFPNKKTESASEENFTID